MAILAQSPSGEQHPLLVQDHQRLPWPGSGPGAAQAFEAMRGRRELIAVKDLALVPRYPPRVTGFQCRDHRLGKVCGISHEGGRHTGFDAIELVIEGGSRHPGMRLRRDS